MRTRRVGDGGAIAVLASIVLLVLGAFMALALNVGVITTTRGQLQNASDSAALAAAGSIDGTEAGKSTAAQMALGYAQQHSVISGAVSIDNSPGNDVKFGIWDFSTRVFAESADNLMINAVRVLDGADGGSNRNAALPVFFGSWLGASTVNVRSSAVAVAPGARANCPIPFVLPSCLFWENGVPKCGIEAILTTKNANTDNTGFIDLNVASCTHGGGGGGGLGNAEVECQMKSRCSAAPLDTRLQTVQNGADLNDKIALAMAGVLSTQGNTVDGVDSSICVFDPNSTKSAFPLAKMDCPPTFNQSVQVVQYVHARVNWVADSSGGCYSTCAQVGDKYADLGRSTACPKDEKNNVIKNQMGVSLVCDNNNGFTNNSVKLRLVL